MGRIRVVVAVLAGLVGVSAIFLGVRISMRDSNATLATENTLIPEAESPRASNEANDVTTETTFDLGVLTPSTTDAASKSTATSTAAPKATTSTLPNGYALVRVNNSSASPVRAFLGDDSEHEAVLAPGDGTRWVVRTSNSHPDAGGARINGTNCGAIWSDVNNIVAGREYHFEVKPSVGICGNGAAMPMVVLTDYTEGASKIVRGVVPDATHALVYAHNLLTDAAWFRVTDDVTQHNWMLAPGTWGEGKLVTADGVDTDLVEGGGMSGCTAAPQVQFTPGHTYRIEAAEKPSCKFVVFDMTTNEPLVVE